MAAAPDETPRDGTTRNGASRDAAAVRIPPPLVFVAVMGAAWAIHRFGVALPIDLDRGIRTGVAVVLGLLSLVFLLSAGVLFRRSGQSPEPWKPTPEIISTGIYRITRNPMYVSIALAQAAIGFRIGNAWFLALLPASLGLVYLLAIRPEEAYLEAKFGESYLRYRDSVRRWL
ncbi:MAG: hypothetical protein DHS20C21_14400 [Gemmatimonadota bacterium]|nr:MAG: hypothetical protein DHS20C21_14400 [Gemmatimonadota bacterium]